ncbi:MAG: DUF4194 domain-containing protein [Chthoniobacter sp.]|uniref:DUF4194 domain-containing protein n=1 Tax=Chthoniobacter sp. TaxID=2510640 RepID=UPI0032AD8C59
MTDDLPAPPLASTLLPELSDSDREELRAAVTELFSRQAIVRDLPGDRELYDWARMRLPWVREICALIGFEVVLNEDEQLIYALPGERSTLRQLRIEWTLVLLGLWYDYDVQLRADGPPVIFTIETFNESLKTKLGDRQPSLSSLREILRFFAARKLVRMEYADDFHRSRIEVLPTIRFVLPFGEIEKVSAALEDLMAGGAEGVEEDHG